MNEKKTEFGVRIGMKAVGPHTACVLLGLWAEGKLDFTLMEYRYLVKVLSHFLEELEEVRSEVFIMRG